MVYSPVSVPIPVHVENDCVMVYLPVSVPIPVHVQNDCVMVYSPVSVPIPVHVFVHLQWSCQTIFLHLLKVKYFRYYYRLCHDVKLQVL